MESVAIERQATTSDLTIMVGDLGDVVGVSVKYSTDLFDQATVRRMLEHLRVLAKAVADDPSGPLLSLSLVTERERQTILTQWNTGPSRLELPKTPISCVSELIDEQVSSSPDSCAVVFDEHWLTFAELEDRASRIATCLRRSGVGQESAVALCLERGLEMIVAVVAVLKAGGAYVPLDPAEPLARIRSMLQVVQPRVMLTGGKVMKRFEGSDIATRCIDIERLMNQEHGGTDVESQTVKRGDSAAYIVFTSGSTGFPHGVCVERQHLLHYVLAISETLQAFASAGYAMVSTIAADLGNTMIFPALCTGGCLHVISSDSSLSPSAFGAYCSQHSIDFFEDCPVTPRNAAQRSKSWRCASQEAFGHGRGKLQQGIGRQDPGLCARLRDSQSLWPKRNNGWRFDARSEWRRE